MVPKEPPEDERASAMAAASGDNESRLKDGGFVCRLSRVKESRDVDANERLRRSVSWDCRVWSVYVGKQTWA